MLQMILSAKRIGNFIRAQDVDYLESDPLSSTPPPDPTAPLFVRGTITWDVLPSDSTEQNPIFQLKELDIEFPRNQLTLIAGKFGSGKTLLLLSLLGEARLLDGDISYAVSEISDPTAEMDDWSLIPSGVAYVPQVRMFHTSLVMS